MAEKQCKKYMLTINNPLEKGLTHVKIKEIAINNFKTIEFICMADEKGQTYHTHIFLYFESRVRWGTVKKYFPTAHINAAKGTVSECVNYIKKSGKWADTGKAETSIPDTFEEWGERPADTQGKRRDMAELYQMVQDKMTNAEIIHENPDYILYIDKIDKARNVVFSDKYKNNLRENIRVIYVSGATNTGKTSGVIKLHGAENVYRVTNYMQPFDSYSFEDVMCFDEFRDSLPIDNMLNYLDKFPVMLRARYSDKVACYTTVYIISNWELERQYLTAQSTDERTWEAFLRRIHEVWVYTDFQKITKYESVKAYFDRKKNFINLSNDIENPFEERGDGDEKRSSDMGKI